MKKRMLALMLCLSMAASMGACGSKNSGETAATEAAESTETAKATVAYDGVRSATIDVNLDDVVKKLADYDGIKVEVEGNYDVTDEMVEKSVLQYLSYGGADTSVEVKDRDVVQEGDLVMVDYAGYKDGEAFEGGTATDQLIDVSNNKAANSATGGYIDGFSDDLLGAKVGDKIDSDVTFPENYGNEDLKGQAVVFKFTVKGIYRAKEYAELTDQDIADAFSQMDASLTSKAAIEEYVKKMLTQQANYYKAQAASSQVRSYMIENSDVTIPDDYLDARLAEIEYSTTVDNVKDGQTLEDYLKDQGTTLEDARKNWRDSLETQIKTEFIFGKIADLENVEVDEDQFNSYVNNLVSSSNGTLADANAVYEYYGLGNAKDGEDAIRQLYRVNQAISVVTDKADITVKETKDTETEN